LVGSEIRETLLSDDMLEQARKEMAKLHKGELARRKASSPKDEVQRQLDTVEKNISRLRRAITLTDDDIDELAQDLKCAQTERKALEAKFGATTQTLSELPDAVFNGLKYYAGPGAEIRGPERQPAERRGEACTAGTASRAAGYYAGERWPESRGSGIGVQPKYKGPTSSFAYW
jgi:hypothetical protein